MNSVEKNFPYGLKGAASPVPIAADLGAGVEAADDADALFGGCIGEGGGGGC